MMQRKVSVGNQMSFKNCKCKSQGTEQNSRYRLVKCSSRCHGCQFEVDCVSWQEKLHLGWRPGTEAEVLHLAVFLDEAHDR
jgi:hypothetical protein